MKKIIFIFFLFAFSCEKKNDVKNYKSKFDGKEIILSKELSISTIPPISSSYQIHTIFNDSLFFGLNPYLNHNSISVFDIKNETFVKNLVIDSNLFKSDIMNLHVHNPDSLFFYSYETKNVYLIDFEGNQINHWNLDTVSGKKYPGKNGFFFPFNAYNKFSYLESDKILIMPIADNYFYSEEGDSNLPKLVIFDIEKNSITDFIAPPFGRLKNRKKLFYPNDVINPQIVVLKGSIYVSYPFDDEIAVFDIGTGKLIKSMNPLVNNELPLFEPKDSEFMSMREKSWSFRVEMPFFENLSYHKETGLFSRVYHYPYSQELDTEKTYLRKSSIVFFDKNLDFVGKTDFENGEIGVFRNSSLKDGYLSGESDYLVVSEDKLVHNKVYKFQ
ncbi:hypothetical protein [Aquiflexum lacus]|uniref:hypothetical protein n=1 Tax=Aquiflexum lacus TaxID=2483805 RepID=UPI001893E8D8|nr:hypothetical protein [Aquiflexum lacus]